MMVEGRQAAEARARARGVCAKVFWWRKNLRASSQALLSSSCLQSQSSVGSLWTSKKRHTMSLTDRREKSFRYHKVQQGLVSQNPWCSRGLRKVLFRFSRAHSTTRLGRRHRTGNPRSSTGTKKRGDVLVRRDWELVPDDVPPSAAFPGVQAPMN